jgi:membrane-associated phospholipid phosphatase
VAGYLLNGLAQIVDELEPWRVLSPFAWVGEPVRDGLPLGHAAGLLAATLAAAALAPPLFGRRDLAV